MSFLIRNDITLVIIFAIFSLVWTSSFAAELEFMGTSDLGDGSQFYIFTKSIVEVDNTKNYLASTLTVLSEPSDTIERFDLNFDSYLQPVMQYQSFAEKTYFLCADQSETIITTSYFSGTEPIEKEIVYEDTDYSQIFTPVLPFQPSISIFERVCNRKFIFSEQ